jgi:MATE family multidrug resistance protein
MTYTKPVFYIAFGGVLLNIPLDLIFVYGYFGAPKLGGVGCGIATTIVSFIMMISIFIYINISEKYKKTKPFAEFTPPSQTTTKEVFKLGLPIGLGIFIELSMFSGAAIILSVLGEIVVAGHSVAINIASLFFMVPLAIGLASSTRVGNLIGERNPKQAKVAATSTIMLCMMGAIINSVIIILFGSYIVGLYTTELPVIELAISLIFFAAIFQLPDGIQMGALGSLRGYKDTFIPMILLLISYWIFAMPIGYYLTNFGFGDPYGAKGMWYGMIIGLTIFSFLSIFRLRWVMNSKIKKMLNQELLQL